MKISRHSRAGFTLIEIMMVVGIMGIAMCAGIPLLRQGMKRQGLDGAVFDMQQACSHARTMAIIQGAPAELRFYPQALRVEVGMAPRDVTVSEAMAGLPMVTSQRLPLPAQAPAGAISAEGFSSQLTGHLLVDMVDVNFVECKGREMVRVKFYPNGTSDDMTIVLHNEMGDYRRLTLDLVTASLDFGPLIPH